MRQRERLAEAVRHLVDATVTMEDATEEQLGTAADLAEAVARHLGREPHDDDRGVRTRRPEAHSDYLAHSPLVGVASPLAPPFTWAETADRRRDPRHVSRSLRGASWLRARRMDLTRVRRGARHGQRRAGQPGYDRQQLSLRYLRPTPLHRPVVLRANREKVDGRRIVSRGELLVDGIRTAEAEGLFVAIGPELAERYFGTDSDRGLRSVRGSAWSSGPAVSSDRRSTSGCSTAWPRLADGTRGDATHIVGTSAGSGIGAYLRLGLTPRDLIDNYHGREPSPEGAAIAARFGDSGDWTQPTLRREWRPPHPKLLGRVVRSPWRVRPEALLGVSVPTGRIDTESWTAALTRGDRPSVAGPAPLDLRGTDGRRSSSRLRSAHQPRDRCRDRGRRQLRDPRLLRTGHHSRATICGWRRALAHQRRCSPRRVARPRGRVLTDVGESIRGHRPAVMGPAPPFRGATRTGSPPTSACGPRRHHPPAECRRSSGHGPQRDGP